MNRQIIGIYSDYTKREVNELLKERNEMEELKDTIFIIMCFFGGFSIGSLVNVVHFKWKEKGGEFKIEISN